MALKETEGLVLRSYNLQDADKIVILLTQKYGLLRGVAKGAKRLKSKFGSSLEPFTIVNFSFIQKDERELVSIKQIDLFKSYFKNTTQLEFLQKFEYISNLLIEFAPPNDPNERLFNMTKICLETASNYPNDLESIVFYFEIWLLNLGGFLPSWRYCNKCDKSLDGQNLTSLDIDFHLICPDCLNKMGNLSITQTQRFLYNNAQKMSPNKFIQFSSSNKDEIINVSMLLKRIIEQITGKKTLSGKVFSV